RKKQRGRRGNADVARVVVVRGCRAGSGSANAERERRVVDSFVPRLGERSARQAEGGHEGQDQKFFHLFSPTHHELHLCFIDSVTLSRRYDHLPTRFLKALRLELPVRLWRK